MSLANTFNSDYFLNYADGKTYGESWQTQSYVPHLVNLIHTHDLPIHTALILGAATGESLEFLRLNGIRAKGIEISEWAVDQARTKPICGDVCSVLPQLVEQGHFFDLIFSSCLQYVPDTEIKKLIPVIATGARYFSHYGGFSGYGDNENDSRLQCVMPYSWWKDLFTQFGFVQMHSPYFWKTSL